MTDDRADMAIDRVAQAIRALQHAWATTRAPVGALEDVAATLESSAEMLAIHRATEEVWYSGNRADLPGRAQVLVPPLLYRHDRPTDFVLELNFGAFYHGAYGVLHGGVLPLVFDDALGRLVNRNRDLVTEGVARTAYLHVDFRLPTPVDTRLVMTGRVDRVVGRKHWLTADLCHGNRVLAEAEGLFITPRTALAAQKPPLST